MSLIRKKERKNKDKETSKDITLQMNGRMKEGFVQMLKL